MLQAPDGSMVPIGEVDRVTGDQDHVLGAVLLTVSHRPILTAELVDDVDWLWAFLLNICKKCRIEGEASIYFPDQPIKIALRMVDPEAVEIELSNLPGADRRARAPRDEFFNAVLAAGQAFFERMSAFLPQHASSYQPSLDLVSSWPPGTKP